MASQTDLQQRINVFARIVSTALITSASIPSCRCILIDHSSFVYTVEKNHLIIFLSIGMSKSLERAYSNLNGIELQTIQTYLKLDLRTRLIV